MRKLVMAIFLTTLFCLLFHSPSSSEILIGKVKSTQDSKLYVANGERIVVSLGRRDGILKGDVLTLVKREGNFSRKAGSCLVTSTSDDESVCRIVRTDTEIGSMDEVEAKETIFLYPDLREPFLTFFSEILKKYDPDKCVSVFLAPIFDEKKNVTALSRRIAVELNNFLSSKRIFKIEREEDRLRRLRDLVGYPDEYFCSERNTFYIAEVERLKGTMRSFDLDVLVMGSYREDKSGIVVTLYSVDRSFGERKIEFTLPLEENLPLAKVILEPYSAKTKKDVVQVRISLEKKHFYPTIGEQKRLAQNLAQRDPDFRYAILQRKISFDRVSPEGIQVILDGRQIKLTEGEETPVEVEEGTHTLSVSFFQGIFFGPELVYALRQREMKETIIELKGKEKEPIFVHIRVSCEPRSERISVDVYRKSDRRERVIKPIELKRVETKPVEVYVE